MDRAVDGPTCAAISNTGRKREANSSCIFCLLPPPVVAVPGWDLKSFKHSTVRLSKSSTARRSGSAASFSEEGDSAPVSMSELALD